MGPRSPAPRSPGPRSPSLYATTMNQSLSTFPYTAGSMSYGYRSSAYAYGSRPSSSTMSRAGSSVSSSGPIAAISSMVCSRTAAHRSPRNHVLLPQPATRSPRPAQGLRPTRTISGGSSVSGSVTGTGLYTNMFAGFTLTVMPTSSWRHPPQHRVKRVCSACAGGWSAVPHVC